MEFRPALKEIVEGTPGGVACVIMGMDGIPIEEYRASSEKVDTQAVGVEYSKVLDEIRKISEMLKSGRLSEVSIGTDQILVVIRMITPDYFLVLIMTPDGNFGKGRYLMRRVLPQLQNEF